MPTDLLLIVASGKRVLSVRSNPVSLLALHWAKALRQIDGTNTQPESQN